MLRERLKFIELRITELADYLQISRPTMYKFINYYDNAEFNLINKKVLKLFNYIESHPLIGKKNVINYILTNLTDIKEVGDQGESNIFKKIKKYMIENPESQKSKFITFCIDKSSYDNIIPYLVDIQKIINKRKLSKEESKMLEPYKKFIESIKEMGE